jgi:hypothetical protein
MMRQVRFVSVNKSFHDWFTVPELEVWAERAWAITVSNAAGCEHVVAVFEGDQVAAWRLQVAFATDETLRRLGRQ